MFGLKHDWDLETNSRFFVLEDYSSGVPRWCPGCGDHGVLTAVQRLARDEQLEPENTVVVSGIGCSSRFPHYMKTYGFHSLHGRALPVASGVRSRRPDLNMFVVTGDGDCTAIGTAHWIHAIRYNMKMTVMLLDNNIYGLTKMQTSPTTPKGQTSFTHPTGALLSPLNPLAITLGIRNASFVAQTVDWNPAHMFSVLKAAHHHPGLAFVRILQRCPHYMPGFWDPTMRDPQRVLLLQHEDGIQLDPALERSFPNKLAHNPHDLNAAFQVAGNEEVVPIGLLYRNDDAERYDEMCTQGLGFDNADRLRALDTELDRFLI